MESHKLTPEHISTLLPNEIFVFGSNLAGYHAGGAARMAATHFGAIYGQGVGRQGQSYAIPTMQGDVETIRPYVDEFVAYASAHPELIFYVTRIGCGIAGFTDAEIAPLFREAFLRENVCLPESFVRVIESPTSTQTCEIPEEYLVSVRGQMRTLMDLLKALNKEKPIHSAKEGCERLQLLLLSQVRGGDEIAFNALRTFWCLTKTRKASSDEVDLDRLERDMIAFHNQDDEMRSLTVYSVLFQYSVAKMLKFIRFTNEFMRYKSYEEIEKALTFIEVSPCSSTDDSYYRFGRTPKESAELILREEWENISRDGVLDNDLLEEITFGRFDRMVRSEGLEQMLCTAFKWGGCHDLLMPDRHDGKRFYAPVYRVKASWDGEDNLEKGCNDNLRRSPSEFEMFFAERLLNNHREYVKVGRRPEYFFVPKSDMTLPVYSNLEGKLVFNSDAEKKKAIQEILQNGYF